MIFRLDVRKKKKMRVCNDLEEAVQSIDRNRRVVLACEFTGHVGGENAGYEEVHALVP